MTTRPLPPLLEPYLRLPPETSLILLTSTLGCSVNWLTCRFISSALSTEDKSVVLVSWMRDLAFWKTEVRRCSGLDLSRQKAFTFINAFSNATSLDALEKSISQAIDATGTKPILILDDPSILLATTSTTPQDLSTFLLTLRSKVHATILTSNADSPLLSAAIPESGHLPTPIETATASFVISQAHVARLVMSVRELDTGAARDLSGVLRVSRGGEAYAFDDGVEEREMLYLVGRDGGVKVFGRGEGN